MLHVLRQKPLKELGCYSHMPEAGCRDKKFASRKCVCWENVAAPLLLTIPPHLFVTDGRCFIQIVSESSRSVFLMSSFRKKISRLKTRLNETINLSSFTGCSASFCHQAFNAGASLDDDLQFLLGFLCSYGLPRACTRY